MIAVSVYCIMLHQQLLYPHTIENLEDLYERPELVRNAFENYSPLSFDDEDSQA